MWAKRKANLFFSLHNFFLEKCSWVLKRKNKNCDVGGGEILGYLGARHAPPGGRAGLVNDTLLPLTMRKFGNDPPCHSRWGMPN